MAAITKMELPLPLLGSGKVREIYELPDSKDLLFVTTDRISCFDVILKNGVPFKGAILTAVSEFWFTYLSSKIASLRTHFITLEIPLQHKLSETQVSQIKRRSMVVRRLEVFPIESIVRGYLTGSAWSSYQKDGTVCGIQLPKGLRESEKMPTPLWTPSTKAPAGEKDENISPEEAANIIGKEYAARVESLSLQIYNVASDYAKSRGIIIADTKFEFGLDMKGAIVLIDEVLTPDSSRFWSATNYQIGRSQESLDKQPVRDWLTKEGLKGKEGVEMTDEVVKKTEARYKEAYELLVGKEWQE